MILYGPAEVPPEAAESVHHRRLPQEPQEPTHGQNQAAKPLQAPPEGSHQSGFTSTLQMDPERSK